LSGRRTAFRTWRRRLGLTHAGAAAVLDYGKRRVSGISAYETDRVS
jgi:hypothetical protein